ncbi:kinase-like domain-containing protein, partial [Dimargaris cristalligena]
MALLQNGTTTYLTESPPLYPTAHPPEPRHLSPPKRYHYHHKHATEHAVIADPSGRFERYDQILGRGAYKKVYVAFDHEDGVEVAWNEIKVDHLRRPDRRKIWSEISILKTLRHDSVINLFHAWTAMNQHGIENIYFVTEFMSSGTLRQFIKKSKGPIKPRVLKNWCMQILRGLDYLHHYNPPIIHRDLKCDNIFVNGNSGHLKIGDLGLATFKHREHASSVLGTPEYMAPEMYEERYNERVDIYAFGMCVLEMVTKEYPYVECTNPAQIYRRVTAGIQPAALDILTDPDIQSFIRHCIQSDPDQRPSAAELLCHPFL